MKSKIKPIKGWMLICPEENAQGERIGSWYCCWHEIFNLKKDALAFAAENNWPKPYHAVRAALSATPGDNNGR